MVLNTGNVNRRLLQLLLGKSWRCASAYTDAPGSAPTGQDGEIRSRSVSVLRDRATMVGKENPRQLPAGGLFRFLFNQNDDALEIALRAEQEVEAVLILQLVHGGRLGDRGESRSDNRA